MGHPFRAFNNTAIACLIAIDKKRRHSNKQPNSASLLRAEPQKPRFIGKFPWLPTRRLSSAPICAFPYEQIHVFGPFHPVSDRHWRIRARHSARLGNTVDECQDFGIRAGLVHELYAQPVSPTDPQQTDGYFRSIIN